MSSVRSFADIIRGDRPDLARFETALQSNAARLLEYGFVGDELKAYYPESVTNEDRTAKRRLLK